MRRREGPAFLMPIICVTSREVLTDRPVGAPTQGEAQVRLKRTPNFSRARKYSLRSEEREAGELLRRAQLFCVKPGNTALMRTMLEEGKEEEESWKLWTFKFRVIGRESLSFIDKREVGTSGLPG